MRRRCEINCKSFFILFYLNAFLVGSAQPTVKSIDKLPDTGQIKSFTEIYGEDSDYIIDAPLLIDNADGTITDKVTGLMWQKNDSGEIAFEDAINYADTLSLSGYQDWRLPNALEAYSIINLSVNNPALDKNFFTNTSAEYWWTSDIQSNDMNKVWVTNAGGGIGNHLKTETISAGGSKKFHARMVRNIFATNTIQTRFYQINDDLVLDSMTNLMWSRRADNNPMSWEDALFFCENLEFSNYDDWRLPNIKELQTLHQPSEVMPCVDATIFPDLGIKKLWSSTSQNNKTANAWYFDTNFGITTQDMKTTKSYVLTVRNNSFINSTQQNPLNDRMINIYPNPVHSEVRLVLSRPISLTVTDILGKVLFNNIVDNENPAIDISDMPNGMLIFIIGNQRFKVVKQ